MTSDDDDVTLQGKDPRKNKDGVKNVLKYFLNYRNIVSLLKSQSPIKTPYYIVGFWYSFLIVIMFES